MEAKDSDGQNQKDRKQDQNSKENIDKAITKMRGSLCDLGHSRTKNRRRVKVMVCMRTWTTEKLMSVIGI